MKKHLNILTLTLASTLFSFEANAVDFAAFINKQNPAPISYLTKFHIKNRLNYAIPYDICGIYSAVDKDNNKYKTDLRNLTTNCSGNIPAFGTVTISTPIHGMDFFSYYDDSLRDVGIVSFNQNNFNLKRVTSHKGEEFRIIGLSFFNQPDKYITLLDTSEFNSIETFDKRLKVSIDGGVNYNTETITFIVSGLPQELALDNIHKTRGTNKNIAISKVSPFYILPDGSVDQYSHIYVTTGNSIEWYSMSNKFKEPEFTGQVTEGDQQYGISISPDGKTVYTSTSNGWINWYKRDCRYNPSTTHKIKEECSLTFKNHIHIGTSEVDSLVNEIKISADGKKAYALHVPYKANSGGYFATLNVKADGSLEFSHKDNVQKMEFGTSSQGYKVVDTPISFAVSSDQKRVYFLTEKGNAEFYEMNNGKLIKINETKLPKKASKITMTDNGKLYATIGNTIVNIIIGIDGKLLEQPSFDSRAYEVFDIQDGIALSPDQKNIYTTLNNNAIYKYSFQN